MSQQIRRCPQCGARLPEGCNVCPLCGERCGKKSHASGHGGWMLWIPVVLILLLAGGITLRFLHSTEPVPEETEPMVQAVSSLPAETNSDTETEQASQSFPAAEILPAETEDLPSTSAVPEDTTFAVSEETPEQAAVMETARDYLDYQFLSYDGLVHILEFEGYSHELAVYAADNCGIDWMEQALQAATEYLDYSSFSRSGLLTALEFDQFTEEECLYAVDHCGADWNVQALLQANSYLEYDSFSRDGLISQLEFEGFSNEEAVYAVDHCGADWMEQAVRKAASYLEFATFTREELIDQLEFEGFTPEEAAYGAECSGL